MIRNGTKTADVFKIAAKKLGKNFIHALGHGIGIEIHESPNLSPKSKEVFKQGMVFTVEPGLYIKNKFGIRIEDDYLINEKGEVEELSKVSKNLVCIK